MGAMLARLQALAPPGPAPAADADAPVYLWPCNRVAWGLWWDVQTQWRHGMDGPTGLDYTAVLAVLDRALPDPAERTSVFAGLRACERTMLDFWGEQRAARAAAKPQ